MDSINNDEKKIATKTSEEPSAFSWLDPHPTFVVILVSPDEIPFGIQKDFLCAKSSYYREYFEASAEDEKVEFLVKLPDTPIEAFAFVQNFMYTGEVFPNAQTIPSYEILVDVWKLGHILNIEGLCDRTLEAMSEVRRLTDTIPSTPLLVQVWKDTPEGSSLRKLLLMWAAEYMRSSESRAEFAKSLPQEVLSELVVAMSSLDTTPVVQVNGSTSAGHQARKNVHYIEEESDDGYAAVAKKQRYSDILPTTSTQSTPKAGPGRKPGRNSLPGPKPQGRRRSNNANVGDLEFTIGDKVRFCDDLLNRMLSGPGFWTRLVGPFKEPVDPATDGVPDYLDKIKRPMDLGTMKAKMDAHGYTSDEEFLGDMQQMFNNCYTYWKPGDPMYIACQKLEKTFQEKYSQMNKWLAKMDGLEDR